jgi:small GTP-binding protein
MSGLIAIVGRPNVGKSALFNRIVRRRIAIVHDEPGVTRDRLSAEAEWHGRPFTLVDTGGIGLLRREKATDVIVKATIEQVDLAIEAANVIILVVNVQEGVVRSTAKWRPACTAAASRFWSRSTKWIQAAPSLKRMSSLHSASRKFFRQRYSRRRH